MTGYVHFVSPSSLSFATAIEQSFKLHWHKIGGLPIYMIRDTSKPLSDNPDCIGIVLPLGYENIAKSVEPLTTPIINYSERLPPVGFAINVRYDNDEIGNLAAEHLITCGYSSFYFLEEPPAAFSQARMEGFAKSLRKNGHRLSDSFFFKKRDSMNPSIVLAAEISQVESWVQSMGPTAAVFAANDLVALRFLRALRACQPELVDTIALIGVDDNFSRSDDPTESEPITSVLPNFSGVGKKAAEVLAGIKTTGQFRRGSVIRVSGAKLIERETTGGFSCPDVLLMRIARWISREINSGHSPKVQDILERFPMSERSLCEKFRKYRHESMRDFIIQKRVQRAARLLNDSDLSVSEIAQMCGFNKHADLTERFSKYMGCPPSEYRKNRVTD